MPFAAKSLQSCPTLCDPRDSSPPGSPVPGILQARTLVWVAIAFSNAWKWKVKVKSLSRVRLLATPRTAAHQAPLSMGFTRQEYWSGLPCHCLLRGENLLCYKDCKYGYMKLPSFDFCLIKCLFGACSANIKGCGVFVPGENPEPAEWNNNRKQIHD